MLYKDKKEQGEQKRIEKERNRQEKKVGQKISTKILYFP